MSGQDSRYAKTTEADPHLPQHPSSGILHVTLPCFEGQPGGNDAIMAPPGVVLQVSIVGPHAFLEMCAYGEGNPKTTVTVKTHIHVDADSLLNALVMQMGVERVRLAIPYA